MSVAVVVSVVSVLISGASLGEGVGQCGETPDIAGVLTVTHHNMHSTQYSYCTVVSTTMDRRLETKIIVEQELQHFETCHEIQESSSLICNLFCRWNKVHALV